MALPNFDPMARFYRTLEFLAFGRDLERARFGLLEGLADRRSILILGEGDGRCLERLLPQAPLAQIHCVDTSVAMLAKAEARIAGRPGSERVTFECADALNHNFADAHYDAVVTMFFLDCFEAAAAEELIKRLAVALQPNAVWLFADFAVPPRGIARIRAQVWLAVLYGFFRWQTGLKTRELPPSEALIRSVGFVDQRSQEFQCGLLRACRFETRSEKPRT